MILLLTALNLLLIALNLFILHQRIHDLPPRTSQPLPESAFVAGAREEIPQPGVRLTTASLRGRGNVAATRRGGRGRSTSRKRVAADVATTSGTAAATSRGSSRRRNYRTGPGSAYWLLVGDEEQGRNVVPDLNAMLPEEEEIPISQNAPTHGNV
jgi:hypothetical protein